MVVSPLAGIREAFAQGTAGISVHAATALFDRGIDPDRLFDAIAYDAPEIIEPYPTDPRGPCGLILCFDEHGDAYHAVCGYPPSVQLVTAYIPDPARWSSDLRRRR
jgi:hypothetical protein